MRENRIQTGAPGRIGIHNPVLRGFHPDPCICRAGGRFYLITSTFEWLPGVSQTKRY